MTGAMANTLLVLGVVLQVFLGHGAANLDDTTTSIDEPMWFDAHHNYDELDVHCFLAVKQ